MCINYDNYAGRVYSKLRWYAWLAIPSILEAFIYHPLTVIFALKGYYSYLTSRDFKWGEMKRKGFKKEANANAAKKYEQLGDELNPSSEQDKTNK